MSNEKQVLLRAEDVKVYFKGKNKKQPRLKSAGVLFLFFRIRGL